MTITLKNNLRLSDIPAGLRTLLMEKLRFPNPKWIENARMGRWNRGIPKELKFYDKLRTAISGYPEGICVS